MLLPSGDTPKSLEELAELINPTSDESAGLGHWFFKVLRNVIQKQPKKVSTKTASTVVELVD